MHLLAALLEPLQDEGALLGDDTLHVEVVHVGVHVALHQRAAVVVLDISHPPVRIEKVSMLHKQQNIIIQARSEIIAPGNTDAHLSLGMLILLVKPCR